MPRRAFILAAGLGTRLRPYTEKVPKPLFHILGVPLLEILLENLKKAGFKEIGLNLHHLAPQTARFLEEYQKRNPEISVTTFYEKEILGPIGALRGARPFFEKSPVLVVNGDILTNFPFATLLEAHKRLEGLATLLLHHFPPYNKVLLRGEEVTGFEEGKGFAYTGLQVVTPELVSRLRPEDRELVPVYERFLEEGARISALVGTGFYWQDIGTLPSYLAAHEDLLKRRAVIPGLPPPPSPCVLSGARVAAGVVFEDWVFLEPGVEVSPEARLRRVVAWAGARIPPGFHQEKLFLPERIERDGEFS